MIAITRIIKMMGVAVCISLVTPAFSDPAPVYDADSMQEDNIGADQAQDMAPGSQNQDTASAQDTAGAQEAAGAFVPNQMPANPTPTVSVPSSSLSIDQRMRRVEQQMNNMQNNDVATRVDSLQDQVQTLRGQVEDLTHQLQQAQNQQKSMYTDLDKRLAQQTMNASKPANATVSTDMPADTAVSNDDTTAVPAPLAKPVRKVKSRANTVAIAENNKSDNTKSAASKVTEGQPNVAEEQQIYQTAYNLIKAKKYNEAVTALQGMLKKYPTGQFASNAHYWLGELYGLMGKNEQALTEFSSVVKTFPDSPRVSDAQLKVGLIYASQTKWLDAKTAFKKVINQYPGTASARLASEQLKQIKIAGH